MALTGTVPDWAVVLLAGGLTTYFWRFIGVIVASRLDPEGALLLWVRAVATALVAALCIRLIIVPSGMLATTDLSTRVAALALGVIVFYAAGRSTAVGVAAAVATLFLSNSLVAAL